MVIMGWSVVGILLEIFGFVNLFGSFFPLVLSFLRNLPIIGNIISSPSVTGVVDKVSGKDSSSMV